MRDIIPLGAFFTHIKDGQRTLLPKDPLFNYRRETFAPAITYADVKLKSGHSEVLPNEVSTFSYATRHVPLNVPIITSPMDTVTETAMAIAIGKEGGVGVIHKNMPPEEQRDQVRKVKYHLSGMIQNPVSVYSDQTMEQVSNMRKEKGYTFHSFTVLDRETNKLVGIISETEFSFPRNYSKTVGEVMSKELITAGPDTDLTKAYDLMESTRKKNLPIVNEKMEVLGMYVFNDVMRVISGESAQYNLDSKGRLIVGAAIGPDKTGLYRVELMKDIVDFIAVDSAHADTDSMIGLLKDIKRAYPSLDVMIGNISESDSAKMLAEAGADAIKVGQGPGSICTTRQVAGIGCPQVTAIYECSVIADYHGIPIIADGGIKYTGDIPVAIGAGAMSIMAGSLFAGATESPGEEILFQGQKYKAYRGMGSIGAMEKGSKDRYGQSNTPNEKLVPEGVEGRVPFTGPLGNTIYQMIGGLRAGMGYVGAKNIAELRLKGNFNILSNAGAIEGHPSVLITREAPNYSR